MASQAPTPLKEDYGTMIRQNSGNSSLPISQQGMMYDQVALNQAKEEQDWQRHLQLMAAGQNKSDGGNSLYNNYPAAGGGGAVGGGTSVVPQGEVDPWSKYRASMGDQLAQQVSDPSANPTSFYQNRLQEMLTPGGAGFDSSDPSYQFRLQQGQQVAERSLAAKGLLGSGNAAIELQQYGQQSASQEYGAQFSRLLQGLQGVSSVYDSQMSRLMKMAGVDQDPAAPWNVANQTTQANASMLNAQANMTGAQKAQSGGTGWNSPIFSMV